MQTFEAEHPKSSYASQSATMRAEFEKQRAREDQERSAMATLGLEIRDFRSYWTVDPNVLGGEAVVVPFFRHRAAPLLIPLSAAENSCGAPGWACLSLRAMVSNHV